MLYILKIRLLTLLVSFLNFYTSICSSFAIVFFHNCIRQAMPHLSFYKLFIIFILKIVSIFSYRLLDLSDDVVAKSLVKKCHLMIQRKYTDVKNQTFQRSTYCSYNYIYGHSYCSIPLPTGILNKLHIRFLVILTSLQITTNKLI